MGLIEKWNNFAKKIIYINHSFQIGIGRLVFVWSNNSYRSYRYGTCRWCGCNSEFSTQCNVDFRKKTRRRKKMLKRRTKNEQT
ncbi:hypothetical protein LCGC14_1737050 [marine sediment metagenome]|uniref:Uncharacterized protein n=1 Tax=marine sediment metagenome TaxID=412755 RepID=A0A0F9JN38_9ZZZZ